MALANGLQDGGLWHRRSAARRSEIRAPVSAALLVSIEHEIVRRWGAVCSDTLFDVMDPDTLG
jgi:hypothetical protein